MTNFEKLKQMDTEEFWEVINDLVSNALRQYLDYVRWLNSEDRDIKHFVMYSEIAEVFPSEAELITFVNELQASEGREPTDEETRQYIDKQTKTMPVLGYTRIFDEDYMTVADMDRMTVVKIPKKKCIIKPRI